MYDIGGKTTRKETTGETKTMLMEYIKMNLRIWWYGWIYLARESDQWRALLNAVMNI
jgi:hypothetical protein